MEFDKTSPLKRLLDQPVRAVSASTSSEVEEYTAFAHGRIGRQPQLTLMLRLANGSVQALAYSYFYAVESTDPERGFTLDFSRAKILIQGRKLSELFRYVCSHRVAEIVEANRSQLFETAAEAPLVEKIEIQKLTG